MSIKDSCLVTFRLSKGDSNAGDTAGGRDDGASETSPPEIFSANIIRAQNGTTERSRIKMGSAIDPFPTGDSKDGDDMGSVVFFPCWSGWRL